MTWMEIFEPGLRYWRKQQEEEQDYREIVPAPGPNPNDTVIDLKNGTALLRPVADDTASDPS